MTEASKRIRRRGEKKEEYYEAVTKEPQQEEPKPEVIKPEPEEERALRAKVKSQNSKVKSN